MAQKAKKRRAERLALKRRADHLEFTLSEVRNEIELQVQAGYSDVNPFAQILINHKELES